jgi:tetraacyldisaccharide 4'-kinase
MSELPRPWYWRGAASQLLRPAGWLYARAQAWREAQRRTEGHEIPLLIVGNPRVGGSGKTPISIDLVERLRARNQQAAWIGRGVGGDKQGRRIGDGHHAGKIGDEARMAATALGDFCYAGLPRSELISQAAGEGCVVAISDDGMQSPDLLPDALLVVLRAEDPWGNGLRLPAGPLREGPECLQRAQLIVWHGLDQAMPVLPAEADERWVAAHYQVEMPDLSDAKKLGVATAIADPERLLRSLRCVDISPQQEVLVRDHGALPLASMDRNTTWLTTEKDIARHAHEKPAGLDFRAVKVRLKWADNGAKAEALLEAMMDRATSAT